MKTLQIEIPVLPPSVNHYYKRTRSGRVFLDNDAVVFLKIARYIAKKQARAAKWEIVPSGKFFFLEVGFEFVNRKFPDPNNMLKLLIDALEGIVFENDKWLLPLVTSAKITGKDRTIVNIEYGDGGVNPRDRLNLPSV